MSARPWFKFFPADWRADPALRMVSLGARALWIEMLCVMHDGTPRGFLTVKGKLVSTRQLSIQAGCTIDEAESFLAELEEAEVFSRSSAGVIFSRKMAREAAVSVVQTEKVKKRWAKANTEKVEENIAGTYRNDTEGNTETIPICYILEPEGRKEADASLSPSSDETPKYPEPFEACWKAYPHSKGRSSKPKALGFWRRLPRPVRDQLPAAAARYAQDGREPKADCGAAGMHLWLRDEKFADWLTPTASASCIDWPDTRWKAALDNYRERGLWGEILGPKPGEPGCRAPPHLLADGPMKGHAPAESLTRDAPKTPERTAA